MRWRGAVALREPTRFNNRLRAADGDADAADTDTDELQAAWLAEMLSSAPLTAPLRTKADAAAPRACAAPATLTSVPQPPPDLRQPPPLQGPPPAEPDAARRSWPSLVGGRHSVAANPRPPTERAAEADRAALNWHLPGASSLGVAASLVSISASALCTHSYMPMRLISYSVRTRQSVVSLLDRGQRTRGRAGLPVQRSSSSATVNPG